MTTLPENLEEINRQLDDELRARIPALTNASVAEWRIWTRIFSIIIRAMQVIVSNFEQWIDHRLTLMRPGTSGWYVDIARSFQLGDDLQILPDGSIGYPLIDPTKQIVAAVAISEIQTTGEVVLKVARMEQGVLTGFTQAQLLAFSNYIDSVKFAGTKITTISTSADMVRYALDIVYDPAFYVNNLGQNIETALADYRAALDFDGVIYVQKLIQALMLVPGVITVRQYVFHAQPAGGAWQLMPAIYLTQAGYFNYDTANSSLVFTPLSAVV